MFASPTIRHIWSHFTGIPMETFTKGWWYRETGGRPRQRTVAEMAIHRAALGAGGNCFDLALWLLHEFSEAGVPAFAVGHDLETEDGHIGVVAQDQQGYQYLCDLGDQWLEPILISSESSGFDPGWHTGFFPAADVQIGRDGQALTVRYRRPGGKEGSQTYDLTPITDEALARACDFSQRHLTRVLCERLRVHPGTGQVAHWEYNKGQSRWSLPTGLAFEEPCDSVEGWTARISTATGIAPEIIRTGFEVYGRLQA